MNDLIPKIRILQIILTLNYVLIYKHLCLQNPKGIKMLSDHDFKANFIYYFSQK